MKRLFFSFCIVLLASSYVFPFPNEPDGFRGIKFGSSIKHYPDLWDKKRTLEIEKNTKHYGRTGDKLSIGDAKLQVIEYTFYKDKFMRVHIIFKDFSNFYHLREILIQQYGPPQDSNNIMKEYFWLGKRTSITFSFNEIKNIGILMITDESIEAEKDSEAKRHAKEAARDL